MIKHIIIFLPLLILSDLLHAQYFEGEIKYINTFKSNIPGISDEKLGSLIGVNQDYFIKGGHYKSISDGSTITMQIYDDKSNRVYNKTRGSDTIYWFDASTNTDSVISYKKEKNRQNILGIQCDVLIAKTKTGTTTYFYNDRYKVDAYRFSNHKYGNWAFFVLETGALPLKTIIESDQFKMESTVVEINPSKLKESFFEIDAGLPIKKSR